MKLVGKHGDPSASHNCFAYKIGQSYRSTDDGEPGGRSRHSNSLFCSAVLQELGFLSRVSKMLALNISILQSCIVDT